MIIHFFNISLDFDHTFTSDKLRNTLNGFKMMRKHITTADMVKKLLNVIEGWVEKSKGKKRVRNRNLETTL